MIRLDICVKEQLIMFMQLSGLSECSDNARVMCLAPQWSNMMIRTIPDSYSYY